ncbi:dolichyl-phosphate beta-glucosyltransferase isoform X3 [Macadamia integrifolia]|uniref:dolichyl-phosphate beta-glucosyltransferase isoform X3 n=1 Tax=Macadamia integrifolia TaxID=60698 RepID=UPI001C4EEA4B|nr:dolichyl-phosphate beta-glucosyltransferase isoform X3 [Macadamia integrifolia]
MSWIWTIAELFVLLALLLILGIGSAIFLEAFRRRSNHDQDQGDANAVFEDPKPLKKVPCPWIFDPAEKYISLIIPAFNEEHRLPGALDETMKLGMHVSLSPLPLEMTSCPFPSRAPIGHAASMQARSYLQQRAAKDKSFSYEVVIVDDGSGDGTNKIAFDFVRRYTIDNVRVILLGRNHGKGEAIRKGMLHSRGELLLMLDADGATKVNDLEKLENQRKWYRNFLMKGFHIVVLLTAGPGIRDTQCGFKMFTRAAARKLFTNIRLKRWCFDVELVYLCKHFSIPIIEISVNWSEIPGSKVNPLSIPNMLWELGLMSVGYRTSMWKIST